MTNPKEIFADSENKSSDSSKSHLELFADLHIHSRFSRACSKALTIPNLVKWARIKGLNLLGTGDFSHPEWLKELKELKPENGILWYEDSEGKFPFILSSEISLIYTQDDKGRRIHLVYLAPDLESVDKINNYLDSKGRRDYDGRPIFKISCRDFVAKMQEINPQIEVIPAHIWTPWFGIFGSKGGFNSLQEAFQDQTKHVHAIETGISSDPEMNLKIKELVDKNISIISCSDSHSFWPWRLGREATIFNKPEDQPITYNLILDQIRTNSFKATIETEPAYGKYHFDGHANCNFSCSPEKTKQLNNLCPVCNKELIIGVDSRVKELSNKEESEILSKKPYHTILPLHEIISLTIKKGMNTKATWEIYNNLIKEFKNEYDILLNVPEDQLLKTTNNSLLTNLIIKNRQGKIKVKPGYDGVYGEAQLDEENPEQEKEQKNLF